MTPTLSTHSTSAQLFWLHTRQCAVLSLRDPMAWLAALYVGMGSLMPPGQRLFWIVAVVMGNCALHPSAPKAGLTVPGLPLTPWQRLAALALGSAWPPALALMVGGLTAAAVGRVPEPQGIQLLLVFVGARWLFALWMERSVAVSRLWQSPAGPQPLARSPRSLRQLWFAGFRRGLAWAALIVPAWTGLTALIAALGSSVGVWDLLFPSLLFAAAFQKEPLGLSTSPEGHRGTGDAAAELLPVPRARLRIAFALHYALTSLALALGATILGAVLPDPAGQSLQATGWLLLFFTPVVVAVRMFFAFMRAHTSWYRLLAAVMGLVLAVLVGITMTLLP